MVYKLKIIQPLQIIQSSFFLFWWTQSKFEHFEELYGNFQNTPSFGKQEIFFYTLLESIGCIFLETRLGTLKVSGNILIIICQINDLGSQYFLNFVVTFFFNYFYCRINFGTIFFNSVHKVKISSKILPVVFSQRKESYRYTANIFQK